MSYPWNDADLGTFFEEYGDEPDYSWWEGQEEELEWEPQEPEAWHRIDLFTFDEDAVLVLHSTNDNKDLGYPSEYASWEEEYSSLEAALKAVGPTRQGVLCRVNVFVDGVPYHGERS